MMQRSRSRDPKCLQFSRARVVRGQRLSFSLKAAFEGCFCGLALVPAKSACSLCSYSSLSNKTWTHPALPHAASSAVAMENGMEDMFKVESSLSQLKPDYILNHVLEAEERQWAKVHLGLDTRNDALSMAPSLTSIHTAPSAASSTPDQQDPGVVLLRHGTSVRKIHNYFSQLEFRKCCMHLAGRKTSAQSMRVVHSSASGMDDDGSALMSPPSHTFVTHLADKELRAFKHAYLCAAYPVLAAPEPPQSPMSPSLVQHDKTPPSPLQRSGDFPRSTSGTVTPYSLHDSGMEEQEDLAFIPSESICTHLQRAFYLSDEKFRDYRYMINKTYVRKSAHKLLAEELAGQLAVLENNCHPFYRPEDFLPPHGYELWRKAENNHITELLGKFWQFSLPFPRNSQDLIAELHSVHDDYHILLAKLLAYERKFHRHAEEEGGILVSPLSTASIRLLKEFGLRYGVGEQFRRILYLDLISMDFNPSMWYLQHILTLMTGIADLLPTHRRALSMVKKEYDLLQGSLVRVGMQASKALKQMKILFPNNKPAGGVELLITVLQKVRDLQLYLMSSPDHEPPALVSVLTDIVQGMFYQTYEKCKTVIRTELKNRRDVHVCPRMLNALIMEMRNEVLDYKNNYEAVFNRYFDISVMAARSLYHLLMRDLENLCEQEQLRNTTIDLRMLALVHRLDQLDRDWSAYIKPQEQTWRLSFQHHIAQWGSVLRLHVKDLVLGTIAGDTFVSQPVQLNRDTSSQSTSSSSSPHSAYSVCLTLSMNSAFSSIPSTPKHGSSLSKDSNITDTPVFMPTPEQPNTSPSAPREDFLSFAEKRGQSPSQPVFSQRPAIVRVVSNTLVSDQANRQGLRAAAGMVDLSSGCGDSVGFITVHRSEDADIDTVGAVVEESAESKTPAGLMEKEEQPQIQKHEEEHVLSLASDFEDAEPVMGIEAYSVENSELESDSADDGNFQFPLVLDVTSLDITATNIVPDVEVNSTAAALGQVSIGGQQDKGKKDTFSEPLQPDSGREYLRSVSQEMEEAEDRARKSAWLSATHDKDSKRVRGKPGTINQDRQMSYPQTGPRRNEEEKTLPAFRSPIVNKLQSGRLSAFRKISTGTSVENESDHQFLQSVQSTVSFPSPALSEEVVIPVSGSVIDLLVLLQRALGFGRTLCHSVYPSRYRGQGQGRSGGDDSLRPPERMKNKGGCGSSAEDVEALRTMLEPIQTKAHFNVVKVLCQAIGVYADNMMCLDLCAVPKNIAKRVIGPALVDHAVRQQQEGKIWGCRHQLEGRQTCYAFYNRKATYLSDRYEPITHKMCVRINNLMACQQFLDWCQTQTSQTSSSKSGDSKVCEDSRVKGESAQGAKAQSSEDSTLHTTAQGAGTSTASQNDNCHRQDRKQQCLEQMRIHLQAVWTALCRLLAFRMNLFLRDGMTVLLSLKAANVSMESCLLPLTTFLRNHLNALSSWLYKQSFRRVLEFLWVYIVQDLDVEVDKLWSGKDSSASAHTLLQALTHLMKFMNNCEKGITRELLLSQADDVVTKLQLFTLSTLQLMALYQRLLESYSEGDMMMLDESRTSVIPVQALHQLQRDLQRRRKCFSGSQLIHWIVRNGDLFLYPDELSLCGGSVQMTTQGAIAVAQQMLDTGLIVDLEAENDVHSRTSSVLSNQEYPEVSLLDQLQACNSHDDDNSYQNSDGTPTPTLTPTPTRTPPIMSEQEAQTSGQIHIPTTALEGSSPTRQDNNTHTESSPDKPTEVHTPPTPEAAGNGDDQPVSDSDHGKVPLSLDTASAERKVDASQPQLSPAVDIPAKSEVGSGDSHNLGLIQGLEEDDPELSGFSKQKPNSLKTSFSFPLMTEHSFQGASSRTPASDVFPSQAPAFASNSLSALLQAQNYPPRYTPGAGSVYDLDMGSICPTPLSLFRMGAEFDNSSEKFYFLPMSVLQSHQHQQRPPNSEAMSPLERSVQHLKNSEETGSLAEKCFTLKVTPLSILAVIYGRRKTDELAHTFTQQMPVALLHRVTAGLETRDTECSVL